MEEGCSSRSNAIEAGELAAKMTAESAAERKDFVMLISNLLNKGQLQKRVDADCEKAATVALR
jgi:hypothetical protein